MRKNKKSFVGLLFLIIIVLLMVGYLAFGLYYRHGFSYGTWINEIYCTGKTVTEVNEELINSTTIHDFCLIDEEGSTSIIKASDIGYSIDYKSQLEKYLKKQNPALWIDNLTNPQSKIIEPQVSFDKELLENAIKQTSVIKKETAKSKEVSIYIKDNGYALYNGMNHVLNMDALMAHIQKTITEGSFEINLSESNCYEDLELDDEMKQTLELFEKINDFQTCEIIYDMGDAFISLEPAITSDWIMVDENGDCLFDTDGSLLFREEGVTEFISSLATQYDTLGITRIFHSTRGDDIEVSGGTYGNQLDQKKEIEYLTQAFKNKVSETHIPTYKNEAWIRGKDDIGSTYIEIDMTEQKMYYYVEGEQLISTDIVTGNTSRRRGTPEGVNFVYNKQKNRILRGEDYASPVKFWMPVKGNIGIHDANWRKEFGGEIYKKNGSHGCINTPTDIMTELYDMVEIGTPVVMFY